VAGLVVVGGGLTSARAVKSYREAGGEGEVVLLSADAAVPYHRPPLSKRYLRGEAEREDTYVEQPGFYAEHGIDLRLETWVAALDTDARELELEGGERLAYERLLVASGAFPRRLDVPGADLEGVHTLRRLDDSTGIREAARNADTAVVVGAGFIGTEVAASLRALGVDVALVHRGDALFELLRSPEVSAHFDALYRRNGVELVFGDELAELRGDGRVTAAVTAGGRELPADLVVTGVGVVPSVAWLEASGVELDDGVVVNERFETNAPAVWAAGDVANFYDPVFDRRRRIEHWSNANYQGAEVGKVLAGAGGGYDVVSTFFTEVFGTTVRVLGDTTRAGAPVLRDGVGEDGTALGLYAEEGRLVGAVAIGQDDETVERLKEQIRDRVPVGEAG
jgi:3-phenylpropionate/trans-cinnamate dioxygenase ferredoxin reductase subunit